MKITGNLSKKSVGENFKVVMEYLIEVKKEYSNPNDFAKKNGTTRQNLKSLCTLKTISEKLINVCRSANISLNYLGMNKGSMFMEETEESASIIFVNSIYEIKKAYEKKGEFEKLNFPFPKEIHENFFSNIDDNKVIAFYHQPKQKIFFINKDVNPNKVDGLYVIKYNHDFIDFGNISPSLKSEQSYIIKTDVETLTSEEFKTNDSSEILGYVLCSMDILIN